MEQYEEGKKKCPSCGYEENTQPDNAMHLMPGTIIQDRYIIGKVIGYGGFGVTYIGYDPILETKIAVKEYLPSEFSTRVVGQTEVTVFSGDKSEQFADGMKKFIDEAKRLAKFHSTPGIVKIYDSFECNNTAYIIMELLEGETLAEKLKHERSIPEDEAIEMMRPVISSLASVHKEGIIHRDIAPDNIFLTKDGHIKLIDFGAARYATTTHSRSLTVVIKPGYSPEEQYRSRGDQGPHTDVYAVAAVLYRMINGETPPDALERRAYFENKKKDILKPIRCASKNHETAIMNALNVRVEDRTPDMETFLKELESTDKVQKRTGKIKAIDLYKWPLWAKIGVPVVAVCLITFGVLFFTGVIGFDAKLKNEIVIPEGQTRVPSVVNNEITKAEERLSEAELTMLISGREYSDVIPYNYIMYQDVTAGSIVPKKTVVGLTISAGTAVRIVPDVTGLEENAAKELLEALGFEVTTEKSDSDSVAKGCVISQSLSPYISAEQGSAVVITVSGGGKAEKSEIPDLVGMKLDEAVKLAEDNGWVIKVTEKVFDKNTEKDTIISQSPSAGQSSDVVELIVSRGWEEICLLDVSYLTQEEATKLLEAMGLVSDISEDYSDSVQKGLVFKQDPEAGAMLEPGSTVNIVVSKGAKPFEMPNVIGKTQIDAIELLEAKGLTVNSELQKDNSKPKSSVLDQSIKAGEMVKSGDEVTLTICDHDSVMTVPSLEGMSKEEANEALSNTGLKAKFTEDYDDDISKGDVISQNPVSGSKVDDGSTVTVKISKGKDPANLPPTSPVGSGYDDYTFQDVDNDGEKELIEVYETDRITYRIYDSASDYYTFEMSSAMTIDRDYIVYDSSTGKISMCGLRSARIITGLFDNNGNYLWSVTVDYDEAKTLRGEYAYGDHHYYIGSREVTEDQLDNYINSLQVLYSYSDPSRSYW